jgi:hypothetical protein
MSAEYRLVNEVWVLVEEALADSRATKTRDAVITANLTLEFVVVRQLLVYMSSQHRVLTSEWVTHLFQCLATRR